MRVILAMLLMLSSYAHASCSSISDDNQRAYCNATTNGQSCANIRDDDQRAYCNATVNGESSANVRDSNLRTNVMP